MNLIWFKYAKSQEEKKDINDILNYSQKLFEVLNNILEEKKEWSDKQVTSWKRYFIPKWSEYQAAHLGYKKALQELQNLIKENMK